MPADNVRLTIRLQQAPSMIPVKFYGVIANGALKFSEDAAGTKILTEALPGKDVYVTAIPDTGYQLKGIVKILNAENVIISEQVVAGKEWHFIVPEGGIAIQAEFEPQSYEITLNITTGKTVEVSVDGGSTKGVKNGDKLVAKYGSYVYFTPNYGESITGLSLTTGAGTVSGVTFQVGAGTATLKVDVA